MPSSAVGKAVWTAIASFQGDGTLAAPSLAWPARGAPRRAVGVRSAVDGHVPAGAAVDGPRPVRAGVGGAADDHDVDARARRRAARRRPDQRRARAPAAAARRASPPTWRPRCCARWRPTSGCCCSSASSRAPPARPASSSRARSCATCTPASAAARFFALLMLVNGLAPILAPLVGGELLHVTDWRGIFVVLAGIGGAAAARGLGDARPRRSRPQDRHGGGLVATLQRLRRPRARPRVHGLRAGDGAGLRRDGGLHRGLAVRPAGHLRRLAAALQRDLRAPTPAGIMAASQVSRALVGRSGRARCSTPACAMSAVGGLGVLVSVRGRPRARRAAAELLRAGLEHRPRAAQRDRARAGRPPAHGRQRVGAARPERSSPSARWRRRWPGSAARTPRCRWRS